MAAAYLLPVPIPHTNILIWRCTIRCHFSAHAFVSSSAVAAAATTYCVARGCFFYPCIFRAECSMLPLLFILCFPQLCGKIPACQQTSSH